MKRFKKLFFILLCNSIFLQILLSCEKKSKIEITKSDEIEIKKIANDFLCLLSQGNDLKDYRFDKYYAENSWGYPGGEILRIYIIDKYILEKIDFRNDEEFGTFVKLSINFHLLAEINENGFIKQKKIYSEILGFIKEKNNWKIQMDFYPYYLTKEGALNWAKKYKNFTDLYGEASKLIFDNIENVAD